MNLSRTQFFHERAYDLCQYLHSAVAAEFSSPLSKNCFVLVGIIFPTSFCQLFVYSFTSPLFFPALFSSGLRRQKSIQYDGVTGLKCVPFSARDGRQPALPLALQMAKMRSLLGLSLALVVAFLHLAVTDVCHSRHFRELRGYEDDDYIIYGITQVYPCLFDKADHLGLPSVHNPPATIIPLINVER